MPKKLDRCVKEVAKKIKKGEIAKTYKDKKTGKREKSNPYALCKSKIKK
ncbi:MAG: hypothetical protein ACTSWK_16810 [Promethearchaeota archaeon]